MPRSVKTQIQARIEDAVTNGRFYQTVPYMQGFGERNSLQQWLLFSKVRCINNYVSRSDKTYLSKYLMAFHEKIKRIVLSEFISDMMGFMYMKQIDSLEEKVA